MDEINPILKDWRMNTDPKVRAFTCLSSHQFPLQQENINAGQLYCSVVAHIYEQRNVVEVANTNGSWEW